MCFKIYIYIFKLNACMIYVVYHQYMCGMILKWLKLLLSHTFKITMKYILLVVQK